ncbi:major facilitator superfamily transporter [Paucilactobacillus hokkaidonensis JCM 18461]|uniref:Major facilitator superfamily transporter n=2 Tax=Paucilactobacillus hokkaidonensis TaxID=1193095 RepID=A0A0A1GVS6_9LACO|nr:MFS transporter [Paucilactobacillus hokkaidonensis]KRO09707.1 multidrug resistance efflux pump [Paucilactobacillus hokkaidonensis]BAP84963.1 major facilitator superfamily transporter [Paucilactobacillus hokkaidonensis JCM 18461]
MKAIKQKMFRPRATWEKNLIVLWFSVFMAGMAFSEIMPFMSLYVDTLGTFTKSQLNLYSGLVFAVTYLVTAVVSPLWGRLADKHGRKIMILRASAGMAIVLGLMGLVTNVWQLMGLRFIQGIFSGYISNANALIATETPKEKSGRALGTLMAGTTGGNLLGPLLGGTLASIFSYRITFFITGGLLGIVFIMSLLFVHETDFKPAASKDLFSTRGVLKALKDPQMIFGMLLTTLIIQASNNSITPIISLYVRELMHGNGNVTFTSGIIAAIPGIATMAAAPKLGALGDRIGTERILTIGFIMAICFFIPTAFVTNVWQLGILRFLIGLSDATMIPQVQTLLAKNTPVMVTGRVFSWNQSFQAIGNIIGPLLGAVVAGWFDYSGVFLSTALLVFMNFLLFRVNVANKARSANSHG